MRGSKIKGLARKSVSPRRALAQQSKMALFKFGFKKGISEIEAEEQRQRQAEKAREKDLADKEAAAQAVADAPPKRKPGRPPLVHKAKLKGKQAMGRKLTR